MKTLYDEVYVTEIEDSGKRNENQHVKMLNELKKEFVENDLYSKLNEEGVIEEDNTIDNIVKFNFLTVWSLFYALETKYPERFEENFSYDLTDSLSSMGYFFFPASIGHHLNFTGGLAMHSLKVLESLIKLDNMLEIGMAKDSMVLATLLHDLCKLDKYILPDDKEKATNKQANYLKSLASKSDVKEDINYTTLSKSYASDLISWYKEGCNGEFPEEIVWDYKKVQDIPLDHGDKSVYMAEKLLELKDNEIMSIRFHMGAWEDKLKKDRHLKNIFRKAEETYPMVKLIALADEIASFEEVKIQNAEEALDELKNVNQFLKEELL